MGHDAFISYSSKDKAAALAVCAALESNGIRCWMAPRDIMPGESWPRAVLRGIADCRMMVLVFSGHANESDQIHREVERAVHRAIPIAPIRITDVMPKDELEYFLSSSHWIDALTPPLEKHLRDFTMKVRGLLQLEGEAPVSGPDLSVTSGGRDGARVVSAKHRWRVAAMLLALLVLGGLAITAWLRHTERGPTLAGAPAAANASLPAGSEFTNTLGMKFKRIEPGTFTMGSPETEKGREKDETAHQVTLTRPFFMCTYLVTRGQYGVFAREAAYRTDAEKEGWGNAWPGGRLEKVNGAWWKAPGFEQADDHPVVEVSWNDAEAFCAWLSGKEGRYYRLPTEAEWEYACRAGTSTAYFWGDDPDAGEGFANCADLTLKEQLTNFTVFNWRDGFAFTAPVGSFRANPWGLYDMIGNAWEWCSDYYGGYPAVAVTDPTGAGQNPFDHHVLRGGSWIVPPNMCRCAFRHKIPRINRSSIIGFRVVLGPGQSVPPSEGPAAERGPRRLDSARAAPANAD